MNGFPAADEGRVGPEEDAAIGGGDDDEEGATLPPKTLNKLNPALFPSFPLILCTLPIVLFPFAFNSSCSSSPELLVFWCWCCCCSRSLIILSLASLSLSLASRTILSISIRSLITLSRSRSLSRSSINLVSTRLTTPISCWYTKKLRRFPTCRSRYASGKVSPLTLIKRHKAAKDDSVYPSALYNKSFRGRVGCGGVPDDAEDDDDPELLR